MTAQLKNQLMIALKLAVNCGLMMLIDMVHQPALYNFTTKAGLLGIAYSIGKGILVREAVVWVPIWLKWSSTSSTPAAVNMPEGGLQVPSPKP